MGEFVYETLLSEWSEQKKIIERQAAQIAELQEQLDLQIPAGVMAQQMRKIAEQATQIEMMREAISKWQPIESAPKDWVVFRAYADELIDLDFNPCGSVEAAWNGEEFIGCVWNGQQDAWYGKAINPTHWMPLPAAPKGPK